jgi:hypothetical protein
LEHTQVGKTRSVHIPKYQKQGHEPNQESTAAHSRRHQRITSDLGTQQVSSRSNLQRSVRSLVVNIIRATPWTVRCRGLQENAWRVKTVCNRARRRTLQACVLVSEHSVSYIDFPDELEGRAVRLRNSQSRAQLMRITA